MDNKKFGKYKKDKKENKDYELINVDSLANCLTMDAWKSETKETPEIELYEMVFNDKEQMLERQIQPKWATLFFNLKEQFSELIHTFAKR